MQGQSNGVELFGIMTQSCSQIAPVDGRWRGICLRMVAPVFGQLMLAAYCNINDAETSCRSRLRLVRAYNPPPYASGRWLPAQVPSCRLLSSPYPIVGFSSCDRRCCMP